jgi:hypothetical protein
MSQGTHWGGIICEKNGLSGAYFLIPVSRESWSLPLVPAVMSFATESSWFFMDEEVTWLKEWHPSFRNLTVAVHATMQASVSTYSSIWGQSSTERWLVPRTRRPSMKRLSCVPNPWNTDFATEVMLLSYATGNDVNEFPWFEIRADLCAKDFQA